MAGCIAFIVFWTFLYSKCSVALPCDAGGWSPVWDFGIS